jgi:hypothetical protein
MKSLSCVAFLYLIFVSYCANTPPTWGGNPRYTVNVTMLYDKPKLIWNFTYYYDATLKVERYEHQTPQAD